MKPSYQNLQVNPFENVIVREPREVSFSVAALNDRPLKKLLQTFSRLEAGSLPRRPVPAERTRLIVSPNRGYGKSHLLGRLFTDLGPRASKIYLRPFQDPQKPWHSILLMTLQELDSCEPGDTEASQPQLKTFAIAVLARLASDLIAAYGIPGYQGPVDRLVALLRGADATTSAHEEQVRKWIEWLMLQLAELQRLSRAIGNIRGLGIDLLGREKAWLKVLGALALDVPHGARMRAALKWLRAEPLESAEIGLLRIDEADSDGRGDCAPQELNALSFQRLRGLCLLGSYHRPFVFCLDQTDYYAGDESLVRALGNCIEGIYAEIPNQMTVMTVNSIIWVREIRPLIAEPQRDRLSEEILLEGVGKEGARELIQARLEQYELGPEDVKLFFKEGLLEKLFEITPEIGVREVLVAAGRRFEELASVPQRPRATLAELFQAAVNKVKTKRAWMAYNQDALMWFVKEVGRGLSGAAVEWVPGNKYFSFMWRWPGRTVAFAFEGGNNHARWQAIAKEATTLSRARRGIASVWYILRTPELDKVPKPTWKQAWPIIQEARHYGFRVIGLKQDQVCEIHAGRELHSSALQGDINYSADETLKWLQTHFAVALKALAEEQVLPRQPAERKPPLAQRHTPPQSSAAPQRPPEPDALDDQGSAAADDADSGPALVKQLDDKSISIVTDMVREHRIVDIDTILGKLGDEGLRDPLLRSVEQHPNLKAHPGPQTIYLQWRNTPSARPS